MQCPCHSWKTYSTCCAPYHRGDAAQDDVALMRARYSAYALGKNPYILQTTNPQNLECRAPIDQRKNQIDDFCKATLFEDLEMRASGRLKSNNIYTQCFIRV